MFVANLPPKKTFVILNPAAGTIDPEQVHNKLEKVLQEYHIPHKIIETSKGDDLHEIVRNALQRGYQRFLAVGGDGTASGVASGLIHTKIPVIIIPAGTSNALAKFLGIPLTLDDSLNWWLADSQKKVLDAMQVEDRFYFLNVSVGVSSNTLSVVRKQEKRRLGSFVYLLKGLQRLFGISPYRFRIRIDGQTHNQSASEVVVANMGIAHFDPIRLDPEIRMDDGKLAVCTIRVRNLFDYLRVARKMISKHPKETRQLECADAFQSVQIQANKRLPIQADGELIGYTPVTVDMVPAAAAFLVPAQSTE